MLSLFVGVGIEVHKQSKKTDHLNDLHGETCVVFWFGKSLPKLNNNRNDGVDDD